MVGSAASSNVFALARPCPAGRLWTRGIHAVASWWQAPGSDRFLWQSHLPRFTIRWLAFVILRPPQRHQHLHQSGASALHRISRHCDNCGARPCRTCLVFMELAIEPPVHRRDTPDISRPGKQCVKRHATGSGNPFSSHTASHRVTAPLHSFGASGSAAAASASDGCGGSGHVVSPASGSPPAITSSGRVLI